MNSYKLVLLRITYFLGFLLIRYIFVIIHFLKSWLPPVSIREATIEKANRLMNRSRSSLSHVTYIDCQGYETDLSECEYNYEPIAYPLQTCMNSMDLVIQCHRPGWSGIRITASDSGSRTIISHVQIHHAGLLDYTRLEYMPSLQLDYFSGTINKLKVICLWIVASYFLYSFVNYNIVFDYLGNSIVLTVNIACHSYGTL